MTGATAGNASAGQTPWTNFSWQDWSVVSEIGFAPHDFLGLGPGVYRIQPFLAQAGGPTQGGIGFNFEQQLGHKSPFGWFGRFGVGGAQVSAGASAQVGTGFVMEAPARASGPRAAPDQRLRGRRLRLEPAVGDFRRPSTTATNTWRRPSTRCSSRRCCASSPIFRSSGTRPSTPIPGPSPSSRPSSSCQLVRRRRPARSRSDFTPSSHGPRLHEWCGAHDGIASGT